MFIVTATFGCQDLDSAQYIADKFQINPAVTVTIEEKPLESINHRDGKRTT